MKKALASIVTLLMNEPETTRASFGPQVTNPQVIANFRFRRISKKSQIFLQKHEKPFFHKIHTFVMILNYFFVAHSIIVIRRETKLNSGLLNTIKSFLINRRSYLKEGQPTHSFNCTRISFTRHLLNIF